MDEAHYSYIVRKRLWKKILHPLLKLERDGWRWDNDNEVSECEVSECEVSKCEPSVLPHKILLFQGKNVLPHHILLGNNVDDVKELKWKRMVEDLSNKGKQLSNCISVCDVSGSMDRMKPGPLYDIRMEMRMEVCVGLGLLTSELSEEPWRGNVIDFSQNPQLHRIEGETLQEKVEFIKRMEWEMGIDFQKVFDRILDVAIASKLEEKKMMKRVFVFTDMGFGEVSENSWETDYYAIQRKYEEKGYGSSVPEIVFWNLKDPVKPPVIEREKGVVLVHGLSGNLVNIFLDNGGVVNPDDLMQEAIAGEEYQRVSVFD